MAEQNKTQMGDGADNYGQAAGQMAKAAKQLGQEAGRRKSRRRDCRRYGGRWPLGCDSFCSLGYASHTV